MPTGVDHIDHKGVDFTGNKLIYSPRDTYSAWRISSFKLAVLVFKALHGQAPQCLTDDCQLVAAAGRRQLYGHLTPSHVHCHGPARASAIVHLVLPDHVCGTLCRSASPLPWTVPTGAKNAFIWLCLQGLVTFCFWALTINNLTSLLASVWPNK